MHDLKPLDILSRFLFHKKHINRDKGVVNTSVFTEKHPKGFSVFNITSLPELKIWCIAEEYVVPYYSQLLLGRCELETQYYEQAHLTIEKSEPPPKHYNIHGMPVGTDYEEAKKLSLRQMMVSKSKLILKI